MSTRLKILLIGIAIVAGVCAVATWMLDHPDRYLPRATAYLKQRTGLDVTIRHATVSLLPVTVTLYDTEVHNPKPFPQGDFLKAPKTVAVLDLLPLMRGKLAIESLTLEKPVFDFISDPDGKFNFENPDGGPQKSHRLLHLSMGPIGRLTVHQGTLLGSSLIDPADKPGPVVFEAQKFDERLSQVNFDGGKNSQANVKGAMTAEAVRFGDIHVRNLRCQVRIAPNKVAFEQFHVKTYRGEGNGDLTFAISPKATQFKTDLEVNGIGIAYLLGEFENGQAKMTGMMEAKLNITGTITHAAEPFEQIAGSGKFTIRKGDFPLLDQGSSMADVKKLRNPSAASLPPAAFSTFGGDMEMKGNRIYSRRLEIDFYGVDVNGSGVVGEKDGRLNCQGVATIEKKQGFFTNVYARMFKGGKEKQGHLEFPVRLVGTLANPQFFVVK